MSRLLQSTMSNTDLLNLYGYEPYGGATVAARWRVLTTVWNIANSEELGHLRQVMLTIHKEVCPDEER